MKRRWLFYIFWPLLWVYTPLTRRVRVLVICGDEVLLVKNLLGPNVWQLPGGGVKIGELIEKAALRELNEETQIRVKNVEVIQREPLVCRQFGLLFRLQFCKVKLNKKPHVEVQKSEIESYMWAKTSELQSVAKEVLIALRLLDKDQK